jgi:hypothetical protein
MDWMIEFIDTLYTPLGSTGSYSAIVDVHNLEFISASTSVLSLLYSPLPISWQRILTQKL